jgi:hypothetical protein
MLEVAEENLLDNKAQVTTYFINDENMKNFEIGNGSVKVLMIQDLKLA